MNVSRSDLTASVSAKGYMIRYKGQNIGGAGTEKASRHPVHIKRDIEGYRKSANITMDSLAAGRGPKHMLDVIKQINENGWTVVDEETIVDGKVTPVFYAKSEEEAVDWLETQDQDKVARGGFGIDGPCEE